MRGRAEVLSLVVLFAGLITRPAFADPVTINFEGLSDGTSVGLTYSSEGLTFSNATVLTSGLSLNEFEFPPKSGQNVVSDDGGPITISFAHPIDSFAAYFTYTTSLQLVGLASMSGGAGVSADSLFSENFTSSGNPSNELIRLTDADGLSSVTITGDPGGGSFAMDDVTFNPLHTPVSPEPGTIWLCGTGLLLVVSARYLSRRRSMAAAAQF